MDNSCQNNIYFFVFKNIFLVRRGRGINRDGWWGGRFLRSIILRREMSITVLGKRSVFPVNNDIILPESGRQDFSESDC
jgi:hypothetical protein